MPLPIGLIAGLGSMAAGMIGNIGARNRQRGADRENQRFWNMQNQYNHPSSQMARLRQAGLNPNMIYGTPQGAAVGNADKIAPSKAAPYQIDNPIMPAIQAKNTEAQTDNLRVDNTVKANQATLLEAQGKGQLTKNLQDALQLSIDSRFGMDAKKLIVDTAAQELKQKQFGNTFTERTMEARIQNSIAQLEYTLQNTEKTKWDAVFSKERAILLRDYGFTVGDNIWARILAKFEPEISKSKYLNNEFKTGKPTKN